jgi:phenylpyruvate tautomerase PptA (4-oxalocrotonate tautomerase family)
MPVIEIAALPPTADLDVPAALGAVASEVASFLEEDPRGTWAILRPIEPGHYAEGLDAPAFQPAGTHPAIVRVFAKRPPEQVPALLEVVGGAVVDALGLEEGNVFVRFEAADTERMFWG